MAQQSLICSFPPMLGTGAMHKTIQFYCPVLKRCGSGEFVSRSSLPRLRGRPFALLRENDGKPNVPGILFACACMREATVQRRSRASVLRLCQPRYNVSSGMGFPTSDERSIEIDFIILQSEWQSPPETSWVSGPMQGRCLSTDLGHPGSVY